MGRSRVRGSLTRGLPESSAHRLLIGAFQCCRHGTRRADDRDRPLAGTRARRQRPVADRDDGRFVLVRHTYRKPFHSDNSIRGKASATQASAPRVTCSHPRKSVERICTHVMLRSSVEAPTVRRKRCRTLASPLLLQIAEQWACLNDNSTPTRFWKEQSL